MLATRALATRAPLLRPLAQRGPLARGLARKRRVESEVKGKVVYEHYRVWHLRGMSLFVASQLVYWSVLWGDTYLPVRSEQARKETQKRKEEAHRNLLGGGKEQSLVLQVYTHPFWTGLGMAVSVGSAILLRLYARNLVSCITLFSELGKVRLQTHSLLGTAGPPRMVPLREIALERPARKDAFVGISVPYQSHKLLLDPAGTFTSPHAGTTSSGDPADAAREVYAALGARWSDAGSGGQSTEVATPGGTPGEAPTLDELRAARLRAKRP